MTGHVAAAAQRDVLGPGQHPPRPRGLARDEQRVARAPRDRHRHAAQLVAGAEAVVAGGLEHRPEARAVEEGFDGRHRIVGRQAPRPPVQLREERDAPRGSARQRRDRWSQASDDRSRRAQRELREGELARGPEADRGQAGGRGDGAPPGELEGQPATERVARDVRAVQALLGEPALQVRREALGARVGGLGRGAAEAREVDRDDAALARQGPDHRIPHAAVAAGAVQQHERRSGAVGVEGEGHGAGESLRKVVCVRLGCCVAPVVCVRLGYCVAPVVCVRLGWCAAPTAASRKGREAAGGSGRGSSSSGVPSCFAVVLRPQGRKAPGRSLAVAARSPCTLRARFATRSTGVCPMFCVRSG